MYPTSQPPDQRQLIRLVLKHKGTLLPDGCREDYPHMHDAHYSRSRLGELGVLSALSFWILASEQCLTFMGFHNVSLTVS